MNKYQKKKYLDEINYFRGLAIIGVVVIHTIGGCHSENNLITFFHINIDQIATYSVPFFIFISGLVLTYNYSDKKKIHYLDFITKRSNAVLIPYVIWSCIYLTYRIIIDQDDIGLILAIKKIIIGSAYFHLYYVVLILQFYLVFPLILKFIMSFKKRQVGLLALTFIFNLLIISLYYYKFDFLNEIIIRKISFFWIFYFMLGSIMGLNFDYYKNVLFNISLKYIGALFYVGLLALIFSYYSDGLLINDTNIFWLRPQVLIYASLFIMFTIKIIGELNPHDLKKPAARFLNELGRYSFGIYLIHILILNILLIIFQKLNVNYNFLFDYFLFPVVLVLSLHFVIMLSGLPFGRFIVGTKR